MLIYILSFLILADEPSGGIFNGHVFTDIAKCEDVARVLMEDQTQPRIVYCRAYKPLEEV